MNKDYLGLALVATLGIAAYFLPSEGKEVVVPLFDTAGKICINEEGKQIKYKIRRGAEIYFVSQEEFTKTFGKKTSELEKIVETSKKDDVALLNE